MSYNRWFRWAALQSQDILFAASSADRRGKSFGFLRHSVLEMGWGGGGEEGRKGNWIAEGIRNVYINKKRNTGK